jgi:hypothetical protein
VDFLDAENWLSGAWYLVVTMCGNETEFAAFSIMLWLEKNSFSYIHGFTIMPWLEENYLGCI